MRLLFGRHIQSSCAGKIWKEGGERAGCTYVHTIAVKIVGTNPVKHNNAAAGKWC